MRRAPWPFESLALTYWNDKLTDGGGAQLQRILGVFAVSRLLEIPYLHSPLLRIRYQGLRAEEDGRLDPHLVERYNALVELPSDATLPPHYDIVEMENVSTEDLVKAGSAASRAGVACLVKILKPYGIVDEYPQAYEAVQAHSPFDRRPASPLRVAIHVRRGELEEVAPDRLLPNEFYIRVAQEVAEGLERLDRPYALELVTETPRDASKRLWRFRSRSDPLADFRRLPNLSVHANEDSLDALTRLSTADVLIMSKSSFSYVAAVLNVGGLSIFTPFWHPPMSQWLRAEADGSVSTADLQARLGERFS